MPIKFCGVLLHRRVPQCNDKYIKKNPRLHDDFLPKMNTENKRKQQKNPRQWRLKRKKK